MTTPPLALPTMSGPLTLLFAVAGGVAVGNLYWSQPLLDFIASDLQASTTSAGWLVTATLLGYAAGILLIVPLGDVVNRRRLLLTMMLCASVALVLCAVAPTMALLLVDESPCSGSRPSADKFSSLSPLTWPTTPAVGTWSGPSRPGSSSASWCPEASAGWSPT